MVAKSNFLIELKVLLDQVLSWSENFTKGDRDYDFDIDDELYKLSEKYHKNFKEGDLLLTYNLLDFYCDAIKHEFKQIDESYSISQARTDIKSLAGQLETHPKFELSESLTERLKAI